MNAPAFLGFGIALAIANGGTYAQAIAYALTNCDFSVKFPRSPILRPITLQDGRTLEQALHVDREEYFLRAECAPGTLKDDTASAMRAVRQFAANEGLSATEFRHTTVPPGFPTVYGRGSKVVAGRPVIFEMQCSFGTSSFMCLSGGAPAEKSPTKEVAAFFQTIAIQSDANSPRWTFLRRDESGREMYVGLSSIVRSGGVSRFEFLQNLREPKSSPYGAGRSIIQVLEADCASGRLRSTGSRMFALVNGGGELVAESQGSPWREGNSSELYASLVTRICREPAR